MGIAAELVLIVGLIGVIIGFVLVLMHGAAAVLDRVAAYFFAPAPPPPGLVRLAALNEQVAAARLAGASNGHRRELPQSELGQRLRELSGSRRRARTG